MIIIRVYTSPTMNRLTKAFADDDHDHEGSGYGYGDGDGEDNHGGEGHEEEGSGDHGEEGSGELEAAGESLQLQKHTTLCITILPLQDGVYYENGNVDLQIFFWLLTMTDPPF